MRMLTIVILALLILSCEKQPMIFEPDTKVSQSVPAAQIGPQIDTLFSSWKEFDNTDPWIINNLYANQLDNGYFGLNGVGRFHNHLKTTAHLEQYKSLTFSFQFITNGLGKDYGVDFVIAHHDSSGTYELFYLAQDLNPNDTCQMSCTILLDSISYKIGSQAYTYRDITDMVIVYGMDSNTNLDHNQPYYAYMSELLVTAERRQQREISP
jgi:hypothetical protein